MGFADFSLTNLYSDIVTKLNTQLQAVGKLFKNQTTGDYPDQVRHNSSLGRLEYWTGSAWQALNMTGSSVDNSAKLNGQAASYYQAASTAINTSNIGSQSVNYASSAGNADTLDGQHASSFLTTAGFQSSLSASGYQKLPSGLIIQWGRITSNNANAGPWSFPISFPNACLGILSNTIEYNGDASSRHAFSITASSFYMRYSTISATVNIFWLAIGY